MARVTLMYQKIWSYFTCVDLSRLLLHLITSLALTSKGYNIVISV